MGFSDSDIRASHTIRIFGTNKAEELLPDTWLDIERIDVIRITAQLGGHFQGIYRRLYWMDDPESNDYAEDGNPARSEGVKKICSPDETDQEDPEEWVPVRTIIEMSWNESTDHDRLQARRGNRTDAENLVRLVEARRCFHRNTTIDDAAEAAADAGKKAYVVASNDYDFIEGSDQKENYIEAQYVSCTLDLSSNKEDEGKNQGVQLSWKNIHYLDFTDEAEGPANPSHGFDPPWSLDPFQAIVNVNWGVVQQWVLGNGDPDEPSIPYTWASIDAGDTVRGETMGASGMGYTVFVQRGFVAFGTITVEESKKKAFLVGYNDGEVSLGTMVEGELQWNTVQNFPDKIVAVSYANDRFFVTYRQGDNTRLAFTIDGADFTSIALTPDDSWGNVTYSPESETYVAIGSHDSEDEDGVVDETLVWATSSNGSSWDTGLSSLNPFSGIGSQGDYLQTSVAFGNGVFVAAAATKHRFVQEPDVPDAFPDFVLHKCAVATSTTGGGWSVHPLPGTVVVGNDDRTGGYPGDGNTEGDTYAVVFVKDKKETPGLDGYFMAAGIEHSNRFDHPRVKGMLWKSIDGASWSLVRSEGGVPGNVVLGPGAHPGEGPLKSIYSTLSAINKPTKLGNIVSL